MRHTEVAYHVRRAAQERAAAAAASDPAVCRVHLTLADHHAARAKTYGGRAVSVRREPTRRHAVVATDDI